MKMESRILVVFVIFLMTWKEILNYEINPKNHLLEREKRNHESDHDDLNRVKQDKDARKATNTPTEPTKLTNSGPEPQSTLPDVSLVNNVPAETMVPRRKIVKTQPTNINTKLNRNANAPYVLVVNKNKSKDKNNGKQSKVTETLIDQVSEIKKVEEKVPVDKEVVDTKMAKKTPSLDFTLRKNQNEPLSEIIKIKSKETQAVRPKPKSGTSKKESKNIKSFDTINDEGAAPKIPIVLHEPSEKSKMYQPRTTTDSDAELEKGQDEIRNREEKISEDISVEDDLETKSIKTDKDKIQNSLVNNLNDLGTSRASNPNCNQIEEYEKDDSEIFIKNTASDLDLQESSQETVESLENAGLIIKNKKYEEIVEYVHPPNIPPSYIPNIDQDITDPILYNDHKIPHFIYQEMLKPEFDLYNYQNYNSYIPDSQQIEQIDGDTVVSYNNYFKMPTPMTSNNIRYQSLPSQNINNNRYCSYLPARQNQTSNNTWTYNRRHENQAGDVDRIWKTWKNTEYYVKSKNALRPIANEKFYSVNQNKDYKKHIQRQNVGNGYY